MTAYAMCTCDRTKAILIPVMVSRIRNRGITCNIYLYQNWQRRYPSLLFLYTSGLQKLKGGGHEEEKDCRKIPVANKHVFAVSANPDLTRYLIEFI
jgi:hypothetical protein